MGIETTASKLSKILETKAAIKQSIANKGVSIPEGTVFGDYPTLIDSIETGGGESYENPDFFEIRTKGGTIYSSLFYDCEPDSIPNISTWDTSKCTTMSGMFRSCNNLTSIDVSNFDTSNVTDMSYMFYSCFNLKTIDVSNWDTSNVTDMNHMFDNCDNLTTIDVSNWDTSNVTNMTNMFYYCKSLTSIDVSNFDTSNVTGMNNIFGACNKLTSLDVSNWDTSNVTNMNSMFNNCNSLITIVGEIDASGLTNGFYPSSSNNPFRSCTSLNTLYLKNIYKNCTMTNISKWSINLGDTKVKDECLIYIINELPDLKNDKGLTTTSSIVFTLPKTNTLTQEQVQVAIDKGWSVANTTY